MEWIVFATIATHGHLLLKHPHCFSDIEQAKHYMEKHKNCLVLSLYRHPELVAKCKECK